MQMKNGQTLLISLLILVFLVIGIFSINGNKPKNVFETIPDPNIELQSKSVDGMNFTLRNVKYSDKELTVGYETLGANIEKNDLVCRLYDNGKLIKESTGGKVFELGEKSFYLTAGIEDVKKLPDKFDLTVEILARSEAILPHDTSVKFNLSINRQ